MKTPQFWYNRTSIPFAGILEPAGKIYAYFAEKSINRTPSYTSTLPVICVGNINMGGTGKTPVAQSIARILVDKGKKPVILLRGYGGKFKKTVRVDTEKHTAAEVGDEAMLHVQTCPTFVSPDRVDGAKAIEKTGEFDVIILDDGFQNPALKKTVSLVVTDGIKGFGNERVFPAGPLRETVENGMKRADALIVMGNDSRRFADEYKRSLPVINARFAFNAGDVKKVPDKRIVAFAGIGHPDKFFTSLEAAGFEIAARFAFDDHRPYTSADIDMLRAASAGCNAPLVTTMKDYIRMPADKRAGITALDGIILWTGSDALLSLFRDKGIL